MYLDSRSGEEEQDTARFKSLLAWKYYNMNAILYFFRQFPIKNKPEPVNVVTIKYVFFVDFQNFSIYNVLVYDNYYMIKMNNYLKYIKKILI